MGNRPRTQGFYQPDLKIELLEMNDMELLTNYTKPVIGYYQMDFIIDGKFKIDANGKKFTVEKGALIIADHNNSFTFLRLTSNAAIVKIYFHDSLIKKHTNYDVLKLFHSLPCGYTFYPANFENMICYDVLNSLIKSLDDRHNEFYMKSKLFMILSELNLYYNELESEEKFDKSNTTITIVEYVKNNFTMNITYKVLRDKFFVCDSTINKVFRQVTGKTFREYLNNLRLQCADDMMHSENNELNLVKIAELSGFRTYSTFYRDYTKKYGVSPNTVFNKNIKNWPLG